MLSREPNEQARVVLVAAGGSLLVESKVPSARDELRWFAGGESDFVRVHDFGLANPEWQVPDLSGSKENAAGSETVVDTRELPPLPGCG